MTYYQSSATLQAPKLRRNQNAVRHRSKSSGLGPISNALTVGILVSVLGLVYLTQVTKTNSYGYEVNNLNNAKQKLLADKQVLEVESARLQALDRIKKSEAARKLKQPTVVKYAEEAKEVTKVDSSAKVVSQN